jgi:protein-S-isoprenylcysteine O-methyltransferase Ste14
LPILALALFAVYFVLAFGVRMALHKRRTGSVGFSGISGTPGSPEWWGGTIFVSALLLAVAAPILDLAGATGPLGFLDHRGVQVAGLLLGAVGLLGTFYAQGAMGKDWRVGVSEKARTGLVTEGPFAVVRNPIYSAMIPSMIGFALLVGNICAIVAVAALIVGLEIQVRLSEEPHLLRLHGDVYRSYAGRVGRFVPHIGKLH